jgi:tRNA(Ile)-lysidine synthase
VREHVAARVGGRSVLCAVSGGVDSVVLLHLLASCGVPLRAAHVEHGIRGARARNDCAFVEALCAEWGIPLEVAHLNVPEAAAASRRGIEETAREMRYAFLEERRAALGLDVIATAHHLNDQAETLLLHLIRGASPQGLGCMREERGTLIRPLLPFSREEIERYARENGLKYVEDETNGDTRLTRNRIRHEILPRMEAINPRAVEAMGRLCKLAQAQNDYVLSEAEKVLAERMRGEVLADVRDLHPGLRGAVLREYLLRQGLTGCAYEDILRLEALLFMGAGRRVSLGKELFERDTNGLRRVIMKRTDGPYPLKMGENVTPLGRFRVEAGPVPAQLDLGPNAQVLDADEVKGTLCVRSRREGDRVRLLGGGTRKLSDVLTDKKTPRAVRDRVPLVTMGEEIVWIAGIAPCSPCRIGPGSARALTIKYSAPEE